MYQCMQSTPSDIVITDDSVEHYCYGCEHSRVVSTAGLPDHFRCFNYNLINITKINIATYKEQAGVNLTLLTQCRVLGARKYILNDE